MLQSKMEAANNVGDDNTARIATLQVTTSLASLAFAGPSIFAIICNMVKSHRCARCMMQDRFCRNGTERSMQVSWPRYVDGIPVRHF